MPYNILILGSQGSGKTTLISYVTGLPFQSITRVTVQNINLLGENLHINFIEGRELSEEHTETLPNIIIILFDLNTSDPCTNIKPWLVESRRVNKDAHITLIGTHLEHPETRVLDTETIDELCIQQEVSLDYYEVGTANIISRYQNIIHTNLASLVFILKLKKLTGKEKNNFLDLVYRWSFSNNSYELTSTLFDHGYHPSKVVVGQFAKQAGISLFNKYPAIQYCMVTNKVYVQSPDEYSLLPLHARPIRNASHNWEPHDMEQPLKTECCRAQYLPRLMIDWSEKKLRCLHPSWFSYKTDLFDYHSLSVIKLRRNKLYFIPKEIYTVPNLNYLDISHNRLSILPGLWILGSKLQVLLANDNSILNIDLENYGFNEETFEPSKDGKSPRTPFFMGTSQDLFELFGEDFFKKSKCQIWMLQLQNNNLQEIPVALLDCLKHLEYLDISNNPIKLLNGNLSNTLKFINVDNLPLISPPRYIADLGLTHLRTYLNQLNTADSSNNIWNRHRIVVVGMLNSGKTALIHKLLEKSLVKSSARMDQGLKIHEWRTKSKTLHFWKRLDSLFDIWDFSGNSIFQPLYNMFRPSSSLHIIVCNIGDFLKEIQFQDSIKEPLRILLMSLQAISWKKDRSLICVLVFTHLDEVAKDEKETKKVIVLNSIRKYIKNMNLVLINDMSNSVFTQHPEKPCIKLNPDGVNLLPTVIDIHFVSSTTGENINKLHARLTQDIFIRVEQAAYAKSVPQLYIEFERRIREIRESVKNRQKRKVCFQQPFERFFTQPLVCSDDIFHSLKGSGLLKREVGPDYGREAIDDMLTFFHEEGILFKHVTGESQCYISFNLQLLGDVLSDILVHSQMEIGNCFNKSPAGILPLDNLAMIFAPTNIPLTNNQNTLEQEGEVPYVLEEFLKFLTANNICTRLSDSYVIVPAGLDTDLPSCVLSAEEGQVGANAFLAGNRCRRIYKMRFIPNGFWNVLLMRLLSNLLPISLPGGIELNKLEQFETLNFQSEYFGHGATQTSFPRDLRTNMEDISKSYVIRCLPKGTLLESDGIRYELKEYPMSEVYYWATGLVITSDQGWNLKVCGCDGMLEPGILTDSQGVQLSLYADNDNVEARLLRITHDVIMQTIEVHFPGLCYTSEKCIPWVEVYALVDNLSNLLPDPHTSHPSVRVKLLSDVLLHSLSPSAADTQLDLRDAIPDMLIKDMPSKLNLTQCNNYIFYEGGMENEEDVFNSGETNSCYFNRCYCSNEGRREIEKYPGGLQQQVLLEAPYKQLMREAYNILKLSNETVVEFIGVSFHPPTCLLSRSPYGSLRSLLTANNTGLDTIASHAVAMQVVRGLFFLEVQNICHTQLTSDTVLVYYTDPMLIKLSDAGISHFSKSKTLVNTREEQDLLLANEPSLPLLQFGFLLYEISTGCRPFEGVYSLQEVMRLALHSKLCLNIEAHLLYTINEQGNYYNLHNRRKTSAINLSDGRSVQLGYGSAVNVFELKQAEVSACHRLCMQPLLENCLNLQNRIILDLPMIASKLTLCAGEIGWSPLSSDINVQCIVCTDKLDLYWSSGTRGLLVGHISPKSGKCIIRALTKPDKRRNNSEQLQAIGNVTSMRIVQSTNQLWIGIEDTNKGALYVYDLPDMNNYYCGQLQDAVLSLMPIDEKWESVKAICPNQEGLEVLKYRVLVGLANGNIMVFMGMKDGEVVENPLAGERAVLLQENKPCRGIVMTPSGLIWAACGHKMLVINPVTLKEQVEYRGIEHHREKEIQAPYFPTKSRNRFTAKETVIEMVINGPWIWTIARRCSYIWIWNWETGRLLLTFDLQVLPDINRKEVSELTAIAPQGNLLWVGTKSGTLLLLDVVMIRALIPEEVEQKPVSYTPQGIKFNRRSMIGTAVSMPLQSPQLEELPQVSDLIVEESPLIAYQHCSKGKVRSIEPLTTVHVSGDVEVICSVEQNETASRLMVWRFQCSAIQSRTKLCSAAYSSNSSPQGGCIKKGTEIRTPLFSEDLNIELPFQAEQKSNCTTDDSWKSLRSNTLPNMGHTDSFENFQEQLQTQENTTVLDISNGEERKNGSQDFENHFYL